MNIKKLPRGAHTDSTALPIFLSGGDEAFLVIQGYTDAAAQLRYIAERLWERGYTVSVPRLPGNGTCGEDFVTTSWKDWLRRVTDEYLDLKCRCEKVHILGVSLGGLLALILAGNFPVEKLVLAAPALVSKNRSLRFAPVLKFFRRKLPRKNYSFAGPLEYSYIAREYWKWNWPGPACSILALRRRAKKILPRVEADTLVIVSKKDGTVPLQAADLVEKLSAAKSFRRVTLEESGHIIFDGAEKEKAADAVIGWLS
ncbi:MAG: alpha/beta fold hydrolase [Spirochaetales bacterium]|jgi:carboxylesterase|nr:alpha/beta fold hydrolase [Spirochaetales bacterium]